MTITSLQKSYTNTLTRSGDEFQLSVYTGEMTPETLVEQATKIIKAFPAVTNGFVDILFERAKEKGFSDQRIKDAVNHVIDNCQYPTPALANFLSFDKRIKIYSYDQVCIQVADKGADFNSFFRMEINKAPFWILKAEKELYSIPDNL